jgi:hypothetical protein
VRPGTLGRAVEFHRNPEAHVITEFRASIALATRLARSGPTGGSKPIRAPGVERRRPIPGEIRVGTRSSRVIITEHQRK